MFEPSSLTRPLPNSPVATHPAETTFPNESGSVNRAPEDITPLLKAELSNSNARARTDSTAKPHLRSASLQCNVAELDLRPNKMARVARTHEENADAGKTPVISSCLHVPTKRSLSFDTLLSRSMAVTFNDCGTYQGVRLSGAAQTFYGGHDEYNEPYYKHFNEDGFAIRPEGHVMVLDGLGGGRGPIEHGAGAAATAIVIDQFIQRGEDQRFKGINRVARESQAIIAQDKITRGQTCFVSAKLSESDSGDLNLKVSSIGDCKIIVFNTAQKIVFSSDQKPCIKGLSINELRSLEKKDLTLGTILSAKINAELKQQYIQKLSATTLTADELITHRKALEELELYQACEAHFYKYRHIMNQALGAIPHNGTSNSHHNNPSLDIRSFPVHAGSRIALMTDGVSDNLTSDELGKIISDKSDEHAVKAIIDICRARIQSGIGSEGDEYFQEMKPDNMTMMVLSINACECD